MNDLKRKSDKAELDAGELENGDPNRDERRKAWLLSEVERMERSFKVRGAFDQVFVVNVESLVMKPTNDPRFIDSIVGLLSSSEDHAIPC
jgi:hypothetical protein